MPQVTPKTDDKVTVDHARRYPRRRPLRKRLTDHLAVAAMFPPLYVLAWLIDRQDRKAGVR